MRWSKTLIPTLYEIPKEAEIISHKLLLKAGFIKKLASGIYIILPLGYRVIQKIETIIREELNSTDAQELLLPALQPKELWEETNRWQIYGKELMRIQDRYNRDFCLGPTHEEIITDIVRKEIKSYKQLPQIFYQIQTKFRDEIRPRFGIMRSREFLMKDAYSFDINEEKAEENYYKVFETYNKIFKRCGLIFTSVEADSGNIGGSLSHEFMVIADTGEEKIVNCKNCGFAANVERAECRYIEKKELQEMKDLKEVLTPNLKTVEEISKFLNCKSNEIIKTLIYFIDKKPKAILIRGDYEVNEVKLKKIFNAEDVQLAAPAFIEKLTNSPMGFTGPIGLTNIEIIADFSIISMQNAITGANKKDIHFINVNIDRDFKVDKIVDLRMIQKEDNCPKCGEKLEFKYGIEVGHTFKLGTKYSKAMKAFFVDKDGKEKEIIMGCYGIGISRTMAAAIEQNYDENGIIWPLSIAPYKVLILVVNVNNSLQMEFAENLYKELNDKGIDTLLDDRDESPGIKFKDGDLIGIPIRITIGNKFLKEKKVEIKIRKTGEIFSLNSEQIFTKLQEIFENNI